MCQGNMIELGGDSGDNSWTTGLDYSTVHATQNDTLVWSTDLHHLR